MRQQSNPESKHIKIINNMKKDSVWFPHKWKIFYSPSNQPIWQHTDNAWQEFKML